MDLIGKQVRHSKYSKCLVVSSAENVRDIRLSAGSNFIFFLCSCVFFLHFSRAQKNA